MLDRIVHESGVVFYRDPRLMQMRVRHAFSTRLGGVSDWAFATLNLGNPGGCPTPDPQIHLDHNFHRLTIAAGLPQTRIWVRQVHGADVVVVHPGESLDPIPEADAIVSDDPNRSIVIRTADCAAILMASADGRLIAGVHAGWRGVVANVIGVAARVMNDLGGPAHAAAIFPSISAEHFEVGLEVVEAFTRLRLPAWEVPGTGKGRADVEAACRQQLEDAGIPRDRCTTSGLCTFAYSSEFFSHRRDKGLTGRMALLAAPAPARIAGNAP